MSDKPAAARAGKLTAIPGARLMRSISTPEGVVLPVELGQRGERAVAFILDILIIFGILFGIYFVLVLTVLAARSASGWLFSAVFLLSFFVRSFYFAFFELRWQGTTPGKRAMGLRVVDRAGSPLRPDAVLARNLMREIEVFLPLSLLMSTRGPGGWGLLLTILWLGIFMLMPLFNRDGLRVGDMIAGTWVVVAPKAALLPDLSETGPGEPEAAPRHGFTKAQLNAYGIYELQTLENVLREAGANAAEMRAEVAKRIMRRIQWPQEAGVDADIDRFLNDFYTALRGHLERKLLFGIRRRDKHDASPTSPES